MSAIRVENLAKRYRIRRAGPRPETLRDAVMSALRRPFRRADADGGPTEEIWALRDVSFEVPAGEVLGIIGRNGAGKSTLLKILARITPPTAGRASIRGRVGALLEVGTGFHRDLTGRENVFLSGVILGMSRADVAARLDQIVAFAGVERFIDTPVRFYSSGMYLRLAFAVAAHLESDVLFVDEVLAVGDGEFQRRCFGTMGHVANEGRTVVVVSHNMSTIATLCTSAILLDGGRVRAHGAVDVVVNDYLRGRDAEGAVKDLTDADHDAGDGGDIRLRRVTLLKGVADTFAVHWRQPLALGLELDVLRDLDEVSFAVALRAADGAWLFVTYNDDDGRPPWTLRAGRHRVEIVVDNPLRPGLYTLNFGAHQRGSHLKNLFAIDAATLEILDFTVDGAMASSGNPGLISGVGASFTVVPDVRSPAP